MYSNAFLNLFDKVDIKSPYHGHDGSIWLSRYDYSNMVLNISREIRKLFMLYASIKICRCWLMSRPCSRCFADLCIFMFKFLSISCGISLIWIWYFVWIWAGSFVDVWKKCVCNLIYETYLTKCGIQAFAHFTDIVVAFRKFWIPWIYYVTTCQ